MSGGTLASPWSGAWRDQAWEQARSPLDILVVGGGITGAGLLLEAARRGLRAALVEERDFAWGTSSRSGKLVHGGMRYIGQGRIGLTRTLLLERDRLLATAPGLVDPLAFLLPTYEDRRKDRFLFGVGVRAYDLLRGRRRSWRTVPPDAVRRWIPGVRSGGLSGGLVYGEAVTDDARLVLRSLREAAAAGGLALNYVRAEALVREGGRVRGAEVTDLVGRRSTTLRASVVVNATGASVDGFRRRGGGAPALRPIRGSHLVLPSSALPLAGGAAFRHPADGRYVYLVPWEGVTLVGTTDLDGRGDADGEPRATSGEVDYLLACLDAWIPGAGLGREGVQATFAGVRPVVDTGAPDPYRESRDSVLWEEDGGLLTVISGKLTGFGAIVSRALRLAMARLDRAPGPRPPSAPPAAPSLPVDLPPDVARRLTGRYGPDAASLVDLARPGELEAVGGTPTLWAELRWGARGEGVRHLDDLLLRRTRLGILLPRGGADLLARVRDICREELGWDGPRWDEEEARYLGILAEGYGVPGSGAAG